MVKKASEAAVLQYEIGNSPRLLQMYKLKTLMMCWAAQLADTPRDSSECRTHTCMCQGTYYAHTTWTFICRSIHGSSATVRRQMKRNKAVVR